ncbi:class I SAM-dependent methyltransferase [Mucilaginibacter corticis]|uniref:Class I SAM-dependent methyltransferase n=1 Tax=Mucilaginibacter corticis TaxID=2597670 RepID=A0A556MS48_9SPHI|nr:class I SAM-dependent methyltransferase [Mucilaginibacter corticis]TSJ42770.1 class I SAM-dependent methyltransferase [Mucilaginibacter corticis]
MASNYDNSAWFYDRLSRLVYGKALINAQVYLLQFIKPNSNILIVGGGTGWILEELAKIHPTGLKITYIEISANMMTLSKKRWVADNQVTFINSAAEDVAATTRFDVLITPFLFDNFKEETLQKIFAHLHAQLKTGGIWLNTDFQLSGKWWQNVLLKSMFIFFRLICGIETSVLPDIEKEFNLYKYNVIAEKTFFGDFILSIAYNKS